MPLSWTAASSPADALYIGLSARRTPRLHWVAAHYPSWARSLILYLRPVGNSNRRLLDWCGQQQRKDCAWTLLSPFAETSSAHRDSILQDSTFARWPSPYLSVSAWRSARPRLRRARPLKKVPFRRSHPSRRIRQT